LTPVLAPRSALAARMSVPAGRTPNPTLVAALRRRPHVENGTETDRRGALRGKPAWAPPVLSSAPSRVAARAARGFRARAGSLREDVRERGRRARRALDALRLATLGDIALADEALIAATVAGSTASRSRGTVTTMLWVNPHAWIDVD
jgi:hypothetical protein